MEKTQQRIFYLDYLRAFMVLLVVLEHCGLPYSPHFQQTAYLGDGPGHAFFDWLHFHNDAVMMPFLFLLAGYFVLPSLTRRGFVSFFQEKIVRLVIPFIVGVLVLVPPQTYMKHLARTDPTIGYLDYLTTVYWTEGGMSSSGFWFLYYLFVLTFGYLILRWVFPSLDQRLGRLGDWLVIHPLYGVAAFSGLACVILVLSDFMWGPFFWIGWGNLFYIRGSRFILKIVFFFMGIALSQSPCFQDRAFLNRFGASWKFWGVWVLTVGTAYGIYALKYFDQGAYSLDVLRALRQDSPWGEVLSLAAQQEPQLIRTTLLGLTMTGLTLFYGSVFVRFLNRPLPVWQSLAAASFGIYIFHEPLQVPLTYWLSYQPWPDALKFMTVVALSWGVSWFSVEKIFKRIPGVRKVLA
jgi:glucan biosynthesis protein C